MIAAIKGRVISSVENVVVLSTASGLSYEVYVPASVLARITENQDSNGEIQLITYHYYQMTPSTASPVLVGFLNEIERDFFLEFIKVSGIGPRAAVKALKGSIAHIAGAIDQADTAYLRNLPGIGPQRAKEIVAKLQGKMGKFTLVRDQAVKEAPKPLLRDISAEAMAVLMQLQYKRAEAEGMIEKVLERNKEVSSVEDLLNEIYKQRITG